MTIQRVGGRGLDSTMTGVTIGKLDMPYISAAYDDSVEPGFLSHAGSQAQDEQSEGAYKTEMLKLKISAMVFRSIFLPAMPRSRMSSLLLPVVVGFQHEDIGTDSDLLHNCRFVAWPQSIENDVKVLEVELSATIQQIY